MQCFFHNITTTAAAALQTAAAELKLRKGKNRFFPWTPRRDHLAGNLQKDGKGETTYTAPNHQKNRCSRYTLPQPFFCVKSCHDPVLAEPDIQAVSAGILAYASQVPNIVFSEKSNDGLSPLVWASALTVAVPLGSCTRFPILSPSPTGPEALKLVFTFENILSQGLASVN